PQQIGEWVPQCYGTADKIQLGAFCVTEPDAGSDVSSLRTRAVYDEAKDEWVLNGTKTWITNGGIADVHVVVASVDPDLGTRGQASFVVPPGTPGLSQGQKFKKHGIRASHTAEVVLEDVRVAGACLLGGKDKHGERRGWAATARRSGRARARCRSSTPGRQPCGSPSRPSRSSAATATSATTPSSAGTATPRSTRSSRAPPRSSASSSPAPSPAST